MRKWSGDIFGCPLSLEVGQVWTNVVRPAGTTVTITKLEPIPEEHGARFTWPMVHMHCEGEGERESCTGAPAFLMGRLVTTQPPATTGR